MTTIVAIERDRAVTFAADSRISWYATHDGWVDKVVSNNGFTFAAAGALRAIQILQYAKLPEPPVTTDVTLIDRFFTKEVVPAIKAAFSDADSDTDSSTLLCSVLNRVYIVASDGSWVRNPDGNYAVGSGSAFALGALKAGAGAKKAVEIASTYDSGTNNDVRVLRVSR